MSDTYHIPLRPTYVSAKPIGSACNMRCAYCYYLEKAALMGYKGIENRMSDELLETFIRQHIESQGNPYVLFTWHGGEPLLAGIDFYRRAIELQKRYSDGRHIDNCIQTNGTLITDEWAQFFAENGWLVGVSIDGTATMHDSFRRMAGSTTQSSHASVMRGIETLNRHGAEWNAMAVISKANVSQPEAFYDFFKSIGCRYIQFTPVVERRGTDGYLTAPTDSDLPLTLESITAIEWGAFTCRLFDHWVRKDVGEVFVQLFDSTLANWVGESPGGCSLATHCGQNLALESNGDVFCCDHFTFPSHKLGNIREQTLLELSDTAKQRSFGMEKRDALPRQCKMCEYLFACNGECPKNRFLRDEYGEPGLNYLCAGYKEFFAHVSPYMDFMARQLELGLPPADIMGVLDEIG